MSDQSDQYDDPRLDSREPSAFGKGVFTGILLALVLEVFAVGAWFILFRVVQI